MKKMRYQFKHIRNELTFWFLVVALVPILIIGALVYHQRKDGIWEREINKLEAVRDLKVDSINNWLDERILDINIASQSNQIKMLCHHFLDGKSAKEMPYEAFHAHEVLNRYITYSNDYTRCSLINAVTGRAEISTDASFEGTDCLQKTFFITTMREKVIYIDDIHVPVTSGKPSMSFSIPITDMEDVSRMSAILNMEIDLEQSLYALLSNRTGLGSTGETLIVNHDHYAVSELRWHANAPLRLRIFAEPSMRALTGKAGVIETDDYRGTRVIAAYAYLPRMQWAFVAKEDAAEVYASVNRMAVQLAILMAAFAVLVYVFVRFLSHALVRPQLEMTETVKKLQLGELSARVKVTRRDEIGFLADSTNAMADALTSKDFVETGNAAITQILIQTNNLHAFKTDLLNGLINLTRSELGAFYLLHGGLFKSIYTVGAHADASGDFDAALHEGELGQALVRREIVRTADIPEDTRFVWKAVSGNAVPREILTIPLIVEKEVRAIISLASLHVFSNESVEAVYRAWPMMNTAFQTLCANEKTEALVRELHEKNQELQAQGEELQAQSEELRAQTMELKEQAEELELQRIQVLDANRLKSEFLSNMSHELRTPLNSVMALSQLMIARGVGVNPAQESEYLHIIERNGRHLLHLINDILDLSKIEAGKLEVNAGEFNPCGTIKRALETVRPLAEQKGLDLSVHFINEADMYSDEEKTCQILLNLLSNAVKFTEAGSIEVSMALKDSNIVFSVHDTGIGIALQDLHSIFDEFRQVDGSTTRRHDGTGLGLAIGRKLARLLGGDIAVSSEAGKGSVFTLTLPRHYDGPVSSWPSASRPASVAQKRPGTPALAKAAIVVIDDDPEMRGLLKAILESDGFDVHTARNGQEGLRIAKEVRPYAITLDILMPDMDGWEVIRALKEQPETRNIPVIIVSVSDDRETGTALGADAFLVKPVDKNLLLAELNRLAIHWNIQRILVADDDPVVREYLTALLSERNYVVVEACGGGEALQSCLRHPPDVLVLDLLMPDMDGFSVLHHLRRYPATNDLPVIVLTAKDISPSDHERLAGTVQRIITKGTLEKEEIIREIEAVLETIKRHHPLPNASFLMVEDNDVMALQIQSVLTDLGGAVHWVSNGAAALDYLRHDMPDGIILDLMMPEMDGFQFLEKLCANVSTAKIPVLVLTAKELNPEECLRLKQPNIRQIIQKGSVNRDELATCMLKLLPGRHAKIVGPQIENIPASQRRKMKGDGTVLVVEDNPDNIVAITAILDYCGIKHCSVTDGEKAIKVAKELLPALILMDVQLPVMSGLEAMREIRRDKMLADIPVIALTARAMKGDRGEILAQGFDGYIAKPIEPDTVEEVLCTWLGKNVKGAITSKLKSPPQEQKT